MSKKPIILYFEDEPDLIEILSAYIGDHYEVKGTASLEKALEILAKDQISITVSDLNLPGVEKHALLKEIQSGYKEIPVIILTGFADKSNILDSFRLGAFEVLEKPINQEKMLETLRRAMEHKALLEKRFSFLMAQFCHEISTPTTGILMISRVLQSKLEKSDKGELTSLSDHAARILNLSKRISDLIKLTKVNLIDCDNFEFVKSDFAEIVHESMAICESSLDLDGVAIESNCKPGELFLNCSALKISQVFINLIKNSFHAIRDKSGDRWIKVTAEETVTHIIARLTDSGTGIPDHVADKMFQREFTTKTFGEGSGLGLAFCQHVIEEHGGTVGLEKGAKNTTFVITLPKDPVSTKQK